MEVRIGTKTYECDRFGIIELADLQDWLQERQEEKIVRKAKMVFGDKLPMEVYTDLKKEIGLNELVECIESDLRAMGYLIWLTVKKNNLSVTLKDVCNEIGDIEDAVRIFTELSPRDVEPEKKEPASQ